MAGNSSFQVAFIGLVEKAGDIASTFRKRGHQDAMEMVMEAAGFGERGDGGLKYPCDGCGRGSAKIGEDCDHCGTKIECAAF